MAERQDLGPDVITGKLQEFAKENEVNRVLVATFRDWVDFGSAIIARDEREGQETVWACVNEDTSIKLGLKMASKRDPQVASVSILVDHNMRLGTQNAHFEIVVHGKDNSLPHSTYAVVNQAGSIPALSEWTGNAYRAVGNLTDRIRADLANLSPTSPS